jgi:hypothetical protein
MQALKKIAVTLPQQARTLVEDALRDGERCALSGVFLPGAQTAYMSAVHAPHFSPPLVAQFNSRYAPRSGFISVRRNVSEFRWIRMVRYRGGPVAANAADSIAETGSVHVRLSGCYGSESGDASWRHVPATASGDTQRHCAGGISHLFEPFYTSSFTAKMRAGFFVVLWSEAARRNRSGSSQKRTWFCFTCLFSEYAVNKCCSFCMMFFRYFNGVFAFSKLLENLRLKSCAGCPNVARREVLKHGHAISLIGVWNLNHRTTLAYISARIEKRLLRRGEQYMCAYSRNP